MKMHHWIFLALAAICSNTAFTASLERPIDTPLRQGMTIVHGPGEEAAAHAKAMESLLSKRAYYIYAENPPIVFRSSDNLSAKFKNSLSYNLLAAGTLANELLTDTLARHHVLMDADTFAMSIHGLDYQGKNLQLAARFSHPKEPGISLYVLAGFSQESAWWDTDILFDLAPGDYIVRRGYDRLGSGSFYSDTVTPARYISLSGRWSALDTGSIHLTFPSEMLSTKQARRAARFANGHARYLASLLGETAPERIEYRLYPDAEMIKNLTGHWPERTFGDDALVDTLSGTVHQVSEKGRVRMEPVHLARILLHRAWGEPEDAALARFTALALAEQLEDRDFLHFTNPARRFPDTRGFVYLGVDLIDADGLRLASFLRYFHETQGRNALRHLYHNGEVKNLLTDAAMAAGIRESKLENKWSEWLVEKIAALEESTPVESETEVAPLVRSEAQQALYEEALSLFSKRKHEEAEKLFRKLLRELPEDKEARYHLSEILFRTQHYEEALQVIQSEEGESQ